MQQSLDLTVQKYATVGLMDATRSQANAMFLGVSLDTRALLVATVNMINYYVLMVHVTESISSHSDKSVLQ